LNNLHRLLRSISINGVLCGEDRVAELPPARGSATGQ
jgi:hypothetical protein